MSVVAHRGASSDVPEHTLAAYRRAVLEGADALECDVRLTADSVLVCVHDRRVDRTSNGRGPVSTLELTDLAELDFGAWRRSTHGLADNETPDTMSEDGRVLTLQQLLEFLHDCERPVELAVETKHPTRYAGLVERQLVQTLDRFGWAHPRLGRDSPVRVMSFSWLSLRRMHALAPSVPTVQLLDRVPIRMRDGTLPAHIDVAGPSIDLIRVHPRYVQRVHRSGHPVHVWTVDDPVDVELCLLLGVDAIITNRPAQVLRQVARSGAGAGGPGTSTEPSEVPADPASTGDPARAEPSQSSQSPGWPGYRPGTGGITAM